MHKQKKRRAGLHTVMVLAVSVLLHGCVTFAGIPQAPVTYASGEEALRSASGAGWQARVHTDSATRLVGRVSDLTSDSVQIGATRVAVADISMIELRTDASALMLAGAAIGLLGAIPVVGVAGYIGGFPAAMGAFGGAIIAGIALGARAARRQTKDDWRTVWQRRQAPDGAQTMEHEGNVPERNSGRR